MGCCASSDSGAEVNTSSNNNNSSSNNDKASGSGGTTTNPATQTASTTATGTSGSGGNNSGNNNTKSTMSSDPNEPSAIESAKPGRNPMAGKDVSNAIKNAVPIDKRRTTDKPINMIPIYQLPSATASADTGGTMSYSNYTANQVSRSANNTSDQVKFTMEPKLTKDNKSPKTMKISSADGRTKVAFEIDTSQSPNTLVLKKDNKVLAIASNQKPGKKNPTFNIYQLTPIWPEQEASTNDKYNGKSLYMYGDVAEEDFDICIYKSVICKKAKTGDFRLDFDDRLVRSSYNNRPIIAKWIDHYQSSNKMDVNHIDIHDPATDIGLMLLLVVIHDIHKVGI